MRRVLAVAGLATLSAAWLGPLPEMARASFAAHMTLHMAVVGLAAPLLAFGIASARLDPARARPHLFPALPASIVDFVVVWAWHLPALHHAARHSGWVLAAEQASFLFAALWLWLASVGGSPAASSRRAAGIVALLFTSMHMTLLGALLALASRPLYTHDAPAALADQHGGGVIMLIGGSVAYLAGALALTRGLLRPADRRRSRMVPP